MNSEPITTVEQYREKNIPWQHEPLHTLFVPKDQLLKVRPNGRLETYVGDTVIFDFDPVINAGTRRWLKAIQSVLYGQFGSHLCTPLPEDSFHITAHSLSDGPLHQLPEITRQMQAHEMEVKKVLEAFPLESVSVKATKIVSMVGKSIVVLFEPSTDADCAALMALYEALQPIKPLQHPLVLHVTLAYYKPHLDPDGNPIPHTGDMANKLSAAFEQILSELPLQETKLCKRLLRYRCFRDMSCYCSREEFLARFFFDKQLYLAENLMANPCGMTADDILSTLARSGLDIDEAEADRMSRLLAEARSKYPHGMATYDILRFMAKDGLDVKTAQAGRACREAFNALFPLLHIDPCTPPERAVSCAASLGGPLQRQWLAAVIVLNMYRRGMLNETAKEYGEENLLRRCLHDLRWI